MRKDAQLLFWDAGTAFVTVIAGVSGGRGDGGGDDEVVCAWSVGERRGHI